MPKPGPLSAAEEIFWRALTRIVITLPRKLDVDLVRSAGITANEYATLMCLSEAPDCELRMADLASAAAVSASRMTRLVDDLQQRGLVTKRSSADDARGNVARLTFAGTSKLKAVRPAHVATVRARVLDHLDPSTVEVVARALSSIAAVLDDKPATRPVDG